MKNADPLIGAEWCVVGEPGNPPLPDGRGAVAYPFEIAKCPVTNAQYCAFLNALPAAERGERFSRLMTEHFFGGIVRDGDGGVFRPKEGFGNKPVVFVSWHDARRFAEWVHGLDDEWDYRLPTADEWLKAAAFRGAAQGWAEYLTGGDGIPSQNPEDAFSANRYDERTGWALPAPHLADVDVYRHPGPWGTLGQAGNTGEWVDGEMPNGWKLALGASLFRPAECLLVTATEGDRADKRLSTFGFRLVRVRNGHAEVKIAQRRRGEEASSSIRVHPCSSVVPQAVPGGASEYVRIGNPGNAPDRLFGGHGRVDYEYEIARCALTNREYAAFLNAVARQDDSFGLFHKDMEAGVLGGIARAGSAGAWTYRAKDGWADKPVVYIDYFSAARYANWLHYGCPETGNSEPGTTEGDAARGAYDTRLFARFPAGGLGNVKRIGRRNPGARYWIPDNDEWYKAAYHDPEKTGSHKYWEFPTRSSTLPDNRDPAGWNAANYEKGDAFAVGAPFYFVDVHAYAASASYYGTLQQGGNAWEWLEDFRHTRGGVLCGLRGGSFGYTETGLHAGNEDLVTLGTRSYVFGVRLARAVPGEGWRKQKCRCLRDAARKVICRLERVIG
jgi:formylglycine-generating enzyme required for sulfatase activity